jgi:hypothetical protein
VVTGTVGILLAVVAGWVACGRRQTVIAVVVPFLGVAVLQTWGIASGRGVSAPSTVTGFPDLLQYYAVQALLLALTLAIALQLRALRIRHGHSGDGSGTMPLVVNCALSALVVGAFEFDRPLFDPGSVARHSTSGPPALGIAGIALLVVTCAALGCATLWRRLARLRAA